MHAYYERGGEQERLAARPVGQLEFERTKEIVSRHLPPPPAVVADIGGGPGAYALWLASLGYEVIHRDLMPLHVEQLRRAAGGNPLIHSMVGDARSLDLPDAHVDALLLLGPLYHLDRRQDRLRALASAYRVLRPGGPVLAAAISRWAPRMELLRQSAGRTFPGEEELLPAIERTGHLPPLGPGIFTGYLHRPAQLRSELTAAGFRVTDLVSVEGPAFLLGDLAERLADDECRRVVMETARALERVPELLGAGSHLLATARKPG
ncbi:MAG: class I SAM-dependent methyltransferase [Nocardiopsaceae bacterium]|nr:class I SAM-dependent methyltransferase [Nocardiopsaceae bacterium]